MKLEEVPKIIGLRTKGFKSAILQWRRQNRGVPYSELLRRGAARELAPFMDKDKK